MSDSHSVLNEKHKQSIEKADIVRREYDPSLVPLYIGSGNSGCCLNAYGLMDGIFNENGEWSTLNNVFMHTDHCALGKWGQHYWLPIFQLSYANPFKEEPKEYLQRQSMYTGEAVTVMKFENFELELRTVMSPYRPDVIAFHISFKGAPGSFPTILLKPLYSMRCCYDQTLASLVEYCDMGYDVQVNDSACSIRYAVKEKDGRIQSTQLSDGIAFSSAEKSIECSLIIACGSTERVNELGDQLRSISSYTSYLQTAVQEWSQRWGNSYIELNDPFLHNLYVRSVYILLCSFGVEKGKYDEPKAPSAPMGWTGISWQFHFPQDISMIHPVFLRLNHLDIAASIVKFYYNAIEQMRDFTQRLYHVEGIFWGWEFPGKPNHTLLADGSPNECQFEIHVSAYPAKMAYETALSLKDKQFMREISLPIILESARFYLSILEREHTGRWGIHLVPSMGQDEFGGKDRRNYLCSLYSAEYTLRIAQKVCRYLSYDWIWLNQTNKILSDGFAFENLYRDDMKIYNACELDNPYEALNQKHPPQLNPITLMPAGHCDTIVRNAYKQRREICTNTKENSYSGWTLADFWLAAAHIGTKEELLYELDQMFPGKYVDKEGITFYEHTGAIFQPYYVTNHGLFLQAMIDGVLGDYFDEKRIPVLDGTSHEICPICKEEI